MTISQDISREVGRAKGRRKSLTGNKRHGKPCRRGDTPATLTRVSSSNKCEMDMVIQPPSTAQLSTVLYPPIVISVDTSSSLTGDSVAGVPSLWGMAILMDEAGEVLQDFLTGSLVDSVRPLFVAGPCCGTLDSRREYLVFRNLRITRPGRYKLRIKLVQMHGSSSTNTPSQTALMQQEVESRIIDTQNAPVIRGELGRWHAASTHAHLPNKRSDENERQFLHILSHQEHIDSNTVFTNGTRSNSET